MNNDVIEYIQNYNKEIQLYFKEIRQIIIDSIPNEVIEKMWAKLPSYYVDEKFIRIIPFKDHLNIEASAINKYRNQLLQFKITPKGMLQIHTKQIIPVETLSLIFKETLLDLE